MTENILRTIPDHNLTDTYADARDAYDLRKEAETQAAWDEMLSDDGDISEVLEMLMEYPEEILQLMRDYHNDDFEALRSSAISLGARLRVLADNVIEDSLS